jgi:hypothetical protein
VYRDSPRTLTELKTAITAHIRNISKADLQKVFVYKIKRVQACIDPRGHHFKHFHKCTATFRKQICRKCLQIKLNGFNPVQTFVDITSNTCYMCTATFETHSTSTEQNSIWICFVVCHRSECGNHGKRMGWLSRTSCGQAILIVLLRECLRNSISKSLSWKSLLTSIWLRRIQSLENAPSIRVLSVDMPAQPTLKGTLPLLL